MGLMYSVLYDDISINQPRDIFELLTPSDACVRLHSISYSAGGGITKEPDDECEMWTFTIMRVTGSPTSGSGGNTSTPQPLNPGGPASGCTVEVYNSTRLTGGTQEQLWAESILNHSGWFWLATPNKRIELGPSTYFVVGLETTPFGTFLSRATMIFEEFGG